MVRLGQMRNGKKEGFSRLTLAWPSPFFHCMVLTTPSVGAAGKNDAKIYKNSRKLNQSIGVADKNDAKI